VVAVSKGTVWPALTHADKILVLLVALGAAGLGFYGHYDAVPGAQLVVEATGRPAGTYSLANFGTLSFVGPLGASQVEIGPEGARVTASPCTHKICMRRGWIRQRGDMAVCVPNRLVLRIAGTAAVDAVVR
jgi:hypothetical protein